MRASDRPPAPGTRRRRPATGRPAGIRVDVAVERGRPGISRALAVRAAAAALRGERVRHASLSITFVSDRTIAAMNRKHLGHRGPTDVISFGFRPSGPGTPLMGDIYVGVEAARRSATERGIPLREELVRLVVHGTLHVMGHDHPERDARERSPMWRVQERVVARVLRSGAR